MKKERQVLLICNDKEVCKKLENSIHGEFGFEVETARDGTKVLKMIKESPWQYDVSVIYVETKEKISGLEILKRIKKDYPEIEVIEAAHAINRTQLKEERERLELLKELGAQIRKKGQLSEYKNIIVETTKKLLHSELSTVFLFRKSDRSIIRQAWYPELDELGEIGERYLEMEGITGKILACKENEHIIYNDEKKIIEEAVPDHLEKYKCLPSWKNIKDKSSRSAIQHLLAVPIVGEKGKVFGVLRVMNKTSNEYTEENPVLDKQGFREPEDVELLKTIASLLSQGLASERKAEKLRILREITKEISDKTDIKEIGDCVVQSVVNLLGYSACLMRLVRGNILELISHHGFKSGKIADITIHTDEGFVGSIVNSEKEETAIDILSDDPKKNRGYHNKEFAREENLRSVCCVPIEGLRGKVVGTIIVYMRHAPYEFVDYEVKDNFPAIAATCSIAIRKVQAKEHLQSLMELLELVHMSYSKREILDVCIKEMLTAFEAHSAIIYEAKKSYDVDRNLLEHLDFKAIYTKNIDRDIDIPRDLITKVKRSGPQTLNADEFPGYWTSIKKQYSQCLVFTLDFKDETLGIVVMFTKVGIPFILPEVDRRNLALAISRQLAIAFKNIEISEEIEKRRVAEPAIISAQYVSGMIHELATITYKGKAAVTYIRNTNEYRKINNRNWKVEMAKIDRSFDDIGTFTSNALKIKDIAQMTFKETLEYRSINAAVLGVLNDSASEIRKIDPKIETDFDKNLNQRHAFFDEVLVKQAIRNLIYNSLKWLSIINGYIKITTAQKDDFIVVTVEDNGQGVKSEIEEYIFDPYYTTSSDGHGIGLFFVKSVAKMHGGNVRLVRPKNPTIFEIKISAKLKRGGW